MVPHIFAYPDPESQNVADPTDPCRSNNCQNYKLVQNFQVCCLTFSLIFMLKLDKPFKKQEISNISLFNSSDLSFECHFFLQFLIDILSRGSAYFCGSGSRKPKS